MAKDKRLYLRVSAEDKELFLKKAEESGMCLSELVCSIIQKRQIRHSVDVHLERQKIQELNRIGILLNHRFSQS